jgi:hypothetical protein
MIYIPQKKRSAAAPMETTNDEKKAGLSLCPLVTVDFITKRSAAASAGKSEVIEKTKASDIQMQQLIKCTVHCLP